MSELAVRRYPQLNRTFRAVAESLFSAPDRIAPGDRLDWVADEAEDMAAHAGARARLVMRTVALLLALIAPLFVRKLGHVASLSLPARTVALQRMESSLAAPLVLALKALLCTVWYEHPDAAAEVQWTGHSTGSIARVKPR